MNEDFGQELTEMGSSKKNNEDGVLLSALFSATQFKDVDHEFSHRQQSFKSIISTPESQKRREYYLEKQKLKRRDLIKQLRSVVSDTSNVNKQKKINEEYEEEKEETEQQKEEYSINNNNNNNNILDDTLMQQDNGNTDDQQLQQTEQQQKQIKAQKNKEKRKKLKEKKMMKEISQYSNHLMLAEAMTDIPVNFEDEWYAVPVSHGKRCLVISQRDMTIARSPDGNIMSTFLSTLPFGSPASRESSGNINNRYCILDCLYEPIKAVYYVLDILCWKGNMLCDCETEFRFFWKSDKLAETTASKRSNSNQYPFISLSSFSCDIKSLEELNNVRLQSIQQQPTLLFNYNNANENSMKDDRKYPIEFILFYHKESQYDFGSTPLFLSLSSQHLPDLIEKLKLDKLGK